MRKSGRSGEQGSILVAVMVFFIVSAAFVATVIATSRLKLQTARAASLDLSAKYVAEAGVQIQINAIRNLRDLATMAAPFAGIDALDSTAAEGVGNFSQTLAALDVIDSSGTTIGQVDVAIDVLNRAAPGTRDIAITSIAYVPSKADFVDDPKNCSRSEVTSMIRLALSEAEVFDYSYFINHWGWFYGNTIIANGNVRANGQFDFGGYGATVNGTPRYESANGADLIGYRDDNNDGVTDGSDGGAYSGWAIVNAQNVNGMAADPVNQHEWQESLPMPNLSDLGVYEAIALAEGGTISVGGTVVANGVLGDDPGEASNLYLVGTAATPIVLNGPIVARGDVIISGVVQGQGTIYSGRNVYVPANLTYATAPSPSIPAGTDEATVEGWRSSNSGADALGLFAREHVVIGNYLDSSWQANVKSWVNHSLNESEEDAGIDGIQGTANGPDGVAGTADDDLLENDGVWTTDVYTAADAALGAIPAGKSVGDPIPGTGEDIDGDGAYDPRTAMAEFNLGTSLATATAWAGNKPAAVTNFSTIATIYFSRIDANFYTNHTLAALMINWGGDIIMNGSLVSRNESIIYGANHIYMNHDARLHGRDAEAFGLYLPVTWQPIQLLRWTVGDASVVEDYLPAGTN
ncbi:MAG: hypothetical protein AB7O52_07805 [Planctomycetota bacterium]